MLLGMLQFFVESTSMEIFSSPYSAVVSGNISINVKRDFVNKRKFGNVSIKSLLQLKLHLWEKSVGCSAVGRQMVQAGYKIT